MANIAINGLGRIGRAALKIILDAQTIRLLSEKDPAKLPWKDLKIDLVFECTGRFTKREDLEKHIQATQCRTGSRPA